MLVKHSLAGVTNFYAGNALTLSNVSESPSERPIRRSPEPTCRTPCRWQSVAGANLPDTSQFWILVCPHGAGPFLHCHHWTKVGAMEEGKEPRVERFIILKREILKSSPPSSSLSFRLSVIQSNWWLRRQRRWCSGQSHFRPIVYFHPQVLLSINHNHHPDKDFNDQSQWWWCWWWWWWWWSVGVNVVHSDPAAAVGRGGISLASPLVPSRRIPASLGGLKDLQEANSGNVITQEPLCIWEHAGP